MKSYQTINISNLCNVGSDVIFSSAPIPQPNNSSASDVRDTGMVLMKGLPFDVGNSNSSSNQRFLMIDKQINTIIGKFSLLLPDPSVQAIHIDNSHSPKNLIQNTN